MRNLLSIFNFRNRDPLAAIILFVGLVMALEAALSFLPQNSLIHSFRVSRVSPGPPADVQIMGDSVARDGIIAGHLAQALPPEKVVYNHSIAATGPEFPYFVLRRDIEAGKVPQTLIYAPSPHTFASLRIPLLIGAFCDWREILEIISTGKEPFELIYGVFCKFSYTLRHREQIGELLKGRKPGTEIPAGAVSKSELSPPPPTGTRFPKDKVHPMYRQKFEVQDFNDVFFQKFLALARKHNIKVYWVTMPVLPVVHDSRQSFGFDAAYYEFLNELRQRHGVEILQGEFLLFEEKEFYDYTHLNKAGAERFTQMLGEKLAAAEKVSTHQR